MMQEAGLVASLATKLQGAYVHSETRVSMMPHGPPVRICRASSDLEGVYRTSTEHLGGIEEYLERFQSAFRGSPRNQFASVEHSQSSKWPVVGKVCHESLAASTERSEWFIGVAKIRMLERQRIKIPIQKQSAGETRGGAAFGGSSDSTSWEDKQDRY